VSTPPNKRLFVRAALASIAAAFCALLGARTTSASFPAEHQRLVFTAESTFGLDVYAMDVETKRLHGLEVDRAIGLNGGVAVSNSGTRLAYTTTVPFEIPEEAAPARFRAQLRELMKPRLQFAPFANTGRSGLIVEIRNTEGSVPEVHGRPSCSPDGGTVAVAAGTPGQLDIYLFRPGSRAAPVDITPGSPGNDLNPRWSPDGRTIAFESGRDGNSEIYLMTPSGQDLRNLTQSPARETLPDWPPDGSRLVFSSNATGNDQLYVVAAAGGPAQRLTTDSGDDRRAVWSPDGNWIAFASNRDGDNEVFVIDPQGRNERQLTANAKEDLVQDWQPLRDVAVPTVRALPGRATARHAILLRYRVADNSGHVNLSFVLFGRHGSARGELTTGADSQPARAGRVYTHRIRLPLLGDEPPAVFNRYCVLAVDPSGNESRASCAPIRAAQP
jgi:Tol biopolymer transport system component